jgi:hypothetical protein
MALERLDLAAYRAVGQVQFLSRQRHAQPPAGRLEGAQGLQGRHPVGHGVSMRDFSSRVR